MPMMQNRLSLTKTAALAFGLFALLAISSRTNHPRSTMRMAAEAQPQEIASKEAVVAAEQPEVKAAEVQSDVKAAEQVEPVVQEKAVEEQAVEQLAMQAKEKVNVHVHINVKREEGQALQLTGQEIADINAALEKTQPKPEPVVEAVVPKVEPVVEVAQAEAKPQEVKVVAAETQPEQKAVETQEVEDVKAAMKPQEAVVLAAAKPQKTASGFSMFFIPMLAMVAVAAVAKFRKPGMLPDILEDKLESMGYPANTQGGFADAPSRSMYGAV
eukprot:TRINITY_DN3360_c0_g2_i1.p1 TRINITY_DN3360_c0_g2~~TRINITY_DN3360_c0_g2_i1.p1  ORF type:complete len:271 (+),score=160.04 TRINITY_DN3360_c0_g2_i1:69-881(+)